MTYDEINPVFRNALGVHEGLRRCGFRSNDIYVHRISDGNVLIGVWFEDGRKFLVNCGAIDCDQVAFERTWKELTIAVNEHALSDDDFERIYTECVAYKRSAEFVKALHAKGFSIPFTYGDSL